MEKKCKRCWAELDGNCVEVMESRLYVVVDEESEEAIILNEGDCLCVSCNRLVTYYRRLVD